MPSYTCYNSAMATTAATTKVTTGTSLKTMLQIATPSTRQIQLISWGFGVDGFSVAQIELIQTDVAATVTAHVAAGVQPWDPNGTPSLMTLGTSATGYTATAEGTTTASRLFDSVVNSGNTTDNLSRYRYDWVYGTGPIVAVSKFLRIRVTFASAVNMSCWVSWDE